MEEPEERPGDKPHKKKEVSKRSKVSTKPDQGMEGFRLEVGKNHGMKPGNIVGAVANKIGLDSEFIGRIDIKDDFSTVDLPEGMPQDTLRVLKKVWVASQQLKVTLLDDNKNKRDRKKKSKPRRQK